MRNSADRLQIHSFILLMLRYCHTVVLQCTIMLCPNVPYCAAMHHCVMPWLQGIPNRHKLWGVTCSVDAPFSADAVTKLCVQRTPPTLSSALGSSLTLKPWNFPPLSPVSSIFPWSLNHDLSLNLTAKAWRRGCYGLLILAWAKDYKVMIWGAVMVQYPGDLWMIRVAGGEVMGS